MDPDEPDHFSIWARLAALVRSIEKLLIASMVPEDRPRLTP